MEKRTRNNVIYAAILAVLFGIGIFLMFYKLNVVNIEKWDEARHGINAYEMMKNNNYIVNTYNYETDYWNLKPPLSYWCIMLGYRIFGFNVVGLKIYSPVAYMMLLAVVAVFMHKRYGKVATVCALVFILSVHVMIQFHIVRYADADTVFSLCYIACFCALLGSQKKPWLLCISGLAFALGFLSKSYHAAPMLLSALIVCWLTRKRAPYRLKHYAAAALCAAVPILIWAGLRFAYDGTAFFYNMIFVDILNRSAEAVGAGDTQPIYYYLVYLVYVLSKPILITAVLATVAYAIEKRKWNVTSDDYAYWIWILTSLLIYTVAKTKYKWYIYPQVFLTCMYLGKLYGALCLAKKKQVKILSAVLLLLPLFAVAKNMVTVYTMKGPHPEEEFLIESVRRGEPFADQDFYCDMTDRPPGDNEMQDIYLTAELYGDMRCHNGGTDAFLQDDDAYLLIVRENYDKRRDALSDAEIVTENADYLLLKN